MTASLDPRPRAVAPPILAPEGTARPAGRGRGAPAVGFSGVTRRFGVTTALDAVDLRISAGETVAAGSSIRRSPSRR